ncbi:MAG: HPr kinase/phosphorylase [Jhaorihella sp.]
MTGPSDASGEGCCPAIVHASCVALDGRALLIAGASGSGKSALALALMGLGAALVADDRVQLVCRNGRLLADAPPPIRGLIEARGVGLLPAHPAGLTPVVAVVDLDSEETERLPPPRQTVLLGVALPQFRKVGAAHFPPALIQYLKAGRQDA